MKILEYKEAKCKGKFHQFLFIKRNIQTVDVIDRQNQSDKNDKVRG